MPRASNNIRLGFVNLHDAFLNASLVLKQMQEAAVETDPERFHISDRARCERLWVALLAVLIEAWESEESKPVRDYIAAATSIDELVALLREARRSGRYAKILKCRHYIAHRGGKAYWDDGRGAPVGELNFNLRLHQAFSKVLLTAAHSMLPRLGTSSNAAT